MGIFHLARQYFPKRRADRGRVRAGLHKAYRGFGDTEYVLLVKGLEPGPGVLVTTGN
jgi:hypothetical protein